MTADDAVPVAGPTEPTFRVAWDVVHEAADYVTVRLRKPEPAPEDSDGIPTSVDAEVSVRGVVSSGHVTVRTFEITDAVKMQVLVALAELAYRHQHGDLVEYPIRTTGGVRMLVLRWQAFRRWFTSVADLDFAEVVPLIAGMPFTSRAGGLAFLRTLAGIVPNLGQFEDTPHLLLEV